MATPNKGIRKPRGRPVGVRDRATYEQKATLAELARTHTESALATLVHVAEHGRSESARVAAANAILDRAYGKPPVALEHTGTEGGPITFRVVYDDQD